QSPRESNIGLPSALKRIAAENLSADKRAILFSGFTTLLADEPYIESPNLSISQRFVWLLSPMTQLVATRLQNHEYASVDQELLQAIDAIGYGHRYDLLDYQAKQEFKRIIELVASDRTLNRALFWHSIRQKRESAGQGSIQLTSWFQAWHIGIMWTINEADFDDFVADIASQLNPDDRLVALSAAFHIWQNYGQNQVRLLTLEASVRDQRTLESRLCELLTRGKSMIGTVFCLKAGMLSGHEF
ncbi:MAG: hypothetical protein H7126_16495, partial [Candidatus Parcubacteria bacterium]|nr:hypothetical protein [Leptolyngbyaceae cyanobacterium LF-bin-113]